MTGPDLPAVMVGWPWKRDLEGTPALACFMWALRCLLDGVQMGVVPVVGNQVGISRSRLIRIAKRQLEEGEVYLTMFDSDAIPLVSAIEALPFVREDFAAGAGIVAAPVHTILQDSETHETTLQEDWGDAPGAVRSATKPWEADWTSFTWVFINPELVRQITAPHSWKTLNGADIPLYTWTGPDTSEDVRLTRRAREIGFPTWMDPRIRAEHWKGVRSPAYEGPDGDPEAPTGTP